ncbi:MAG: hypothetical protein PHX51_05110 [Clostridia bacterium]|nr:hypothetical protein [Clostridia bacterium]
MQKVIERIVLILILISLVVAVFGMVFDNSVVTYVGLVILMVAAVAYSAIQVIVYIKNTDEKQNVQLMIFAIITVVVAIAILCLGLLMMTGKLL